MSNLNATEKITDYIKENILNGNFKIDSKLPSERKIADQFNVSRIPVRSAIEKLCEEGILKTVPYSSPIIKGFKKLNLFDNGEPFKNDDIQMFYVEALRTRQLIESEATKLAAINATEDEIKVIKKAYLKSIDELDKVYKGLLKECSDADLHFHQEIIKSSHCSLFIRYYELIPKTIFSNQYFGFKYRTSLKDMMEHHHEIMNALEKKDGDLAYRAMYNHLEDVIELFERI
ncbi:GntR family transcriptional regulator [Clostridium sp. MSJ-4]|uniref:GntR family transcriptional regulator n=1 Tax=Clostridium simiarum TaxID=2841506 RepID=A0ABS6F3V5_9CLOT|nr:GntR family transcriptional regulator [Clostridium simiarum]MBU5592298.1 GntR family transcriptional regulator [Clostridium simiarum]